jgi:hypothetical protein
MGKVAAVAASAGADFAGDWADYGASTSTAQAATDVPCAPLHQLLADHALWLHPGNGTVAVLAVDAEGLDAEVVAQALDLPRHRRPFILAFEHAVSADKEHTAMRRLQMKRAEFLEQGIFLS